MAAASGVILALLLGWAAPAGAHPLGNFTTNRYARIDAGAQLLRIHYVLDEAELVAFRERAELRAGEQAFADARAASIASNLRLRIDGEDRGLRVAEHHLTQPAGEGGLTTLRLEILFEAALGPVTSGPVEVTFEDRNQPERLGWREVVARPVSGSRIRSSDVRQDDRSNALRDYPTDRSVAPLDVRRATFTFDPGDGNDADVALADLRGGGPAGSRSPDRLVALVNRSTSSPLALLSALGLALGFGAVHALGPGHGKMVMAAYLVSTRGRRRDAVTLGAIVSLMHTASVLVLALVLSTAGRNVAVERIYPGLTVVAGVLVLGVGARLLSQRLRARRARLAGHASLPDHDHDHGGAHGHGHGHGHDHGDGHVHGPGTHTHDLPAGVKPLSRAGLIALGSSGGLFPSPSAVIVLLAAFGIGRAPLGLALIGAFSLGLALVLVLVGLLLVAGRDRFAGTLTVPRLAWLPVVGAGAVSVLGAVLIAQGVVGLS